MTSTTTDFPVGTRVSGGHGEDHDTGTVIEAVGAEAEHAMNDGNAVLVAWDSGVRTWTPISDMQPA